MDLKDRMGLLTKVIDGLYKKLIVLLAIWLVGLVLMR